MRNEFIIKKARLENIRFFKGEKWLELRKGVLLLYGKICMCCGHTGNHVDHIKPRSIFYKLSYDIRNLQVLCESCNRKKSYTNQTDYRTDAHLVILEGTKETNPIVKKYYAYRVRTTEARRKKAYYMKNKCTVSDHGIFKQKPPNRKPKIILRKRATLTI